MRKSVNNKLTEFGYEAMDGTNDLRFKRGTEHLEHFVDFSNNNTTFFSTIRSMPNELAYKIKLNGTNLKELTTLLNLIARSYY